MYKQQNDLLWEPACILSDLVKQHYVIIVHGSRTPGLQEKTFRKALILREFIGSHVSCPADYSWASAIGIVRSSTPI